MGCSSSISTKTSSVIDDILQEPEDEITLDDVLSHYPSPAPSRLKKKDIFKAEDFKEIDKHAKSAPVDVCNSFEALIDYLTKGLRNDLEKVRAIFVWVGSSEGESKGPPDSPNRLMIMVHKRRCSYMSVFTRLCRAANIPCTIVWGVAKSVTYEVGDSTEKVSKLGNRWNAVYVKGEWRIIFTLWAFSATSGHKSGKYTLVETKGQTIRKKEKAADGKDITQFNEYYFLTDAEDFQYIAKANKPKWQLVSQPFNMEQFASVPHLRQTYFTNSVKISSEFKSRLQSLNGETKVSFKAEDPKSAYSIGYEIFFNDDESNTTLPTSDDLDLFVFMETDLLSLTVRYPVNGIYKLDVFLSSNTVEALFCSFKLFAEDVTKEARPYPCNPGKIGWGPSQDTEKEGLVKPSQKQAIVYFHSKKVTNFKFSLIRQVSLRAELVHNEIKTEELQQYVTQSSDSKQVQVNVQNLPKNGEYGLRLYAKDKSTNTEKNVCNYLLTSEKQQIYSQKKQKRENVTEKKVRSRLKEVTTGQDLEKLTEAIEKFRNLKLDDMGDLTAALDRQKFLEVKTEIRNAISRRHFRTLEKAIERATNSPYESELAEYIREAREIRNHMEKLDRFAHEILALQQTTVSELHRYKTPQVPVEDAMIATFLLLGVPKKQLQEWTKLQTLLRTTGKKSLMNRIRKFDTVNVTKETATSAQKILSKHSEYSVRLASPAGGTFFVWANHVVTDILENENKTQ